jgi:uncharacterized membrane protein YfcA
VIEPVGLNALLYTFTGMAAGLLGAILGLGGGVVMVPVMTIFLGVPAHVAVAASLVGVVATSVSSSAGYMQRQLPLVRVGLHMELTTLVGAVAGSVVAGYLAEDVIGALFSLLLFYTSWTMWRGRKIRDAADDPDQVAATPLALAGSGAAGAISGVLGVGGGVMKVPILNLLLGAPIHRSTSTSTFMMGLTAAAGSVAYWLRGELLVGIAAPLVLGVLIGGRLGPRLAVQIDAPGIKRTFAVVLIVVAIRMSWGLFA